MRACRMIAFTSRRSSFVAVVTRREPPRFM
jgi:hypothetical protein